jgi:cobalt-zinc-cadmium efflux system protein
LTQVAASLALVGSGRSVRKNRLRIALFLTLAFFVVEVIGGVVSRSLALIADAAHMFTDSASVHIRAAEDRPREEVLNSVRKLFEEHAGVHHATIQVETGSGPECRDGERHP